VGVVVSSRYSENALATHKHYGKAQSEGELELEPGKHKITLQFANAYHVSYGKEFAKTITVNVNGA